MKSFSVMRVADAPVELKDNIFYLPMQIGFTNWAEALISNGLPVTDFLIAGRQARTGECSFAEPVPTRAKIVTSRMPYPLHFFSIFLLASRQNVDVLYAMLPSPSGTLSLIVLLEAQRCGAF